MDISDRIGSISPLVDTESDMYGLELEGDVVKISGLMITTRHPSKISIAESKIDFLFGNISRSFALERADGKIVAFTNPDGTRTEVVWSE